jgi:ADP-ribose pyrophosphatase YjhB (NUDIX family)
MILKVLAYITRTLNGQIQLLVFDHHDYPDAGTQVPAGTVNEGESIEQALFREIQEESGLTTVKLVRKLADYESQQWGTLRHIFHLTASADVPDSWSHTVHGSDEDQGMVFEYRWITLEPEIELAGEQHQWLELI